MIAGVVSYKVERFNGYLKRSFLVPLNATLRAAGLKLDADTANREVMRWLNEVANTRIHATTGVQPCARNKRGLVRCRSAQLQTHRRSRMRA